MNNPTTYQTVVFTVWVVIQVIGVLATAAMIGKPRKPLEASTGVLTLVWATIWIALFWTAFIL